MDFIKIGNKIRAERNKNKWTQEQLAEKCDISVNFMSLIENGRSMSISTLLKLANAFGVTVDYLLSEFSAPQSDNLIDETIIALKGLKNAEKRYFMNMITQYAEMRDIKD